MKAIYNLLVKYNTEYKNIVSELDATKVGYTKTYGNGELFKDKFSVFQNESNEKIRVLKENTSNAIKSEIENLKAKCAEVAFKPVKAEFDLSFKYVNGLSDNEKNSFYKRYSDVYLQKVAMQKSLNTDEIKRDTFTKYDDVLSMIDFASNCFSDVMNNNQSYKSLLVVSEHSPLLDYDNKINEFLS